MSGRWLPILLLAALAVAAFLFLFHDPPTSPPPRTEGSSTATTELPAAAAPEAATAPEAVAPTAEVLDRVTLELPSSTAQATMGTPVTEGGVLVSVVDGDSGEPLPRADVFAIDVAVVDETAMQLQLSTTPDFEALFTELGVLYHCDGQGQVRLPQPGGDLILAGRTPTHFNFAFNIERDQEEVTLRLNPVELLAVKVVDPDGRPVEGAPVCLRMRSNFFSQDLMSVQSDGQGLAHLKLFDLLKTVLKDNDVFAALQVLTPEPIETAIDINALPQEPPRLVLPPLGQVEVRILQPDGQPATETFLVDLALVDPDQDPPSLGEADVWEQPREHLSVRGRDGHAYFPLVGFDTQVKVMAVSLDGERRAEAVGRGPVRGGDKVVFSLTPEVKRPVLVGRILNAEGMVGKNLLLRTSLRSERNGGSSTSNAQLRTDEEGRFRYLLEDAYEAGSTRSLTLIMKATKRKPQRTVKIDLSRPYGPGEHDLGDLVVRVPPLIAEGIVLAPDGSPLKGADVTPQIKTRYGEGADDFYWNGQWELRAETDQDGHFEIHGELDSPELRLQASHPDYLPADPYDINVGTAGLELRMRQAAKLKVKLLLDEGIPVDALQAQLEQADETGTGTQTQQAEVGPHGAIEFSNLEPREGRLKILAKGSHELLHDHPGINLATAAGMVELPDIDLRGRLTAMTLTVVDAGSGRGMKDMNLQFPGRGIQWGNFKSPLQFVTAEGSLDFNIHADGYRTLELKHVDGDRELEMHAGLQVEVVVDNIGELPSGWRLFAHLYLIPDEAETASRTRHYWSNSESFTIDGSGRGQGRLGSPGRYGVSFSINHLTPDGKPTSTTHGLPQTGSLEVEVADVVGMQSLHVNLPAEGLASTIESVLADEAQGD